LRGTTVAGKAAAEGSSNSITLLPDAGGGVGQIAVSNSAGTQIMSVPFQTTSLTSAFTAPAPPVIVPANQLQNLYGSNITTVLPPAPTQQQQDGPASEATTVVNFLSLVFLILSLLNPGQTIPLLTQILFEVPIRP
jgi:trimeric autotransporter adhesin